VIVLVGFMGAGKTTVGRSLAGLLGEPFVDTDREIERRAGASISHIFSTRGEEAFRDLERQVVAETLVSHHGVIALGGGALGDPATRSLLRSAAGEKVVHLDVELEEARARVGDDLGRPLLSRGDVGQLYSTRRLVYQEVAFATVMTTGRAPEEIAREIAARARGNAVQRVVVASSGGSYDVVIGRGIARSTAAFVPGLDDAEQVFVATDSNLTSKAAEVAASFGKLVRAPLIELPPGEQAKTLTWAGRIYDALARGAAHRHDVVVAVGGGVVTDVGGFVASTFNRGMPVVPVPTSLIAQADAAIGGKTGINLPEGKNLVGTFHPPRVVVCDVEALRTLPAKEMRAGLAEVIKHGLIADPGLVDFVKEHSSAILSRDDAILTDVVSRSARIKAAFVSADERENARRAELNYGHTFAHAVEHARGFELSHGEAVAIGMMAAAHLGRVLGRLDDDAVELHRSALSAVGLPVSASLEIDALERAWLRDKKYRGGVRFVLLARIGQAEAGIQAPREAIGEALERLKA
jgi:shikimate kinase / 3-dehydroquinate synthase